MTNLKFSQILQNECRRLGKDFSAIINAVFISSVPINEVHTWDKERLKERLLGANSNDIDGTVDIIQHCSQQAFADASWGTSDNTPSNEDSTRRSPANTAGPAQSVPNKCHDERQSDNSEKQTRVQEQQPQPQGMDYSQGIDPITDYELLTMPSEEYEMVEQLVVSLRGLKREELRQPTERQIPAKPSPTKADVNLDEKDMELLLKRLQDEVALTRLLRAKVGGGTKQGLTSWESTISWYNKTFPNELDFDEDDPGKIVTNAVAELDKSFHLAANTVIAMLGRIKSILAFQGRPIPKEEEQMRLDSIKTTGCETKATGRAGRVEAVSISIALTTGT